MMPRLILLCCCICSAWESYAQGTELGPQTEPFALVESDTVAYGQIAGVLALRNKYRVYYQNRTDSTIEYVESMDLARWSPPVRTELAHEMRMFQHDGKVFGYAPDGNTMQLYSGFDAEKGFAVHEGEAYAWRQDGVTSMHVSDAGVFRNAGRIRGNNRPVNEGGWGGNLPPYPEAPFDDRRGISYHENATFEPGWAVNRPLADPAEIFAEQLEGKYDGYHDASNPWVPDFYEPNLMPDGKLFLKVYWKRKDRRLDRRVYSPGIEDHRRYRLTGVTYCIPAVLKDGGLVLCSDKSIIPLSFHARRSHPEVHWATRPDAIEVGQISMAPFRIEKDGWVYMFYNYRADVHYEGHPSYMRGIYQYRLPVADFEKLFAH